MTRLGATVLYRLSEQDADAINRRRADYAQSRREWREEAQVKAVLANAGYQAHVGNDVAAGQQYPATVVRVWEQRASAAPVMVQLQVHLDGTDTYWATSVVEGPDERQYTVPGDPGTAR